MTKLVILIGIAVLAVGFALYGIFVSGGLTKLVILIGVAVVMVGFALYGFFVSGRRDDISNTTETSGWMG